MDIEQHAYKIIKNYSEFIAFSTHMMYSRIIQANPLQYIVVGWY